jgi:trans-2,3-dihydro-3-hydroxyanthranilate isomerase
MSKLTFYIVDVFAEQKYAGNQLAVFRGAGGLSSEEMQRIAKEMNYSETTFIMSDEPRDGGYDVRIFTPEEEVPFAGHPTLGSAYIVQKEIIGSPVKRVALNLKVGQIPVTWDKDEQQGDTLLWMKQRPPAFGETFAPEKAAAMLGITAEDIDARFPVQEVSTGLASVIVPLKTLDAVRRCRTNRDLYLSFVRHSAAKAILVFAPEAYEPGHQLNARVFVDYFGIPEDPATGSAAGNLAGYLARYRYFGASSVNVRMEQGYEIKRPSLLYLKSAQTDAEISVEVGGKAVLVARGEWI